MADKLMLTSGEFSSTLKTSQDIGSIDTNPGGPGWDGTDTPWTGTQATKLYLQSGQFTSTLKTSEAVGGVDTGPRGCETDDYNTRVGAAVTARRRVGFGAGGALRL